MNKVFLLFIFATTLTSCIISCNSKNILVFLPISSRSVKNVYLPLIKELASTGHNITTVSAAISPPIENVVDIVLVPGEKVLERLANPFELRKLPVRIRLTALNPDLMDTCNQIYEHEEFKELAQDPKGKFDLVILNAVGNYCFYGLIHAFQAPVIGVMTFSPPNFVTETYGLHLPYSFVPFTFMGFTDKMSFQDRVQNIFLEWGTRFKKHFESKPENDKFIASKHADAPPIEEFERTFSLLLSNTHYTMNSKLPLTPDIIEVGGMHCRPSKQIEEENLQKWLDESTNGFIYFSFGSVIQASQMPLKYKTMFTQVFANLSVNVLWKWEGDITEFGDVIPPNVRLGKWLPQQDVLGHKNIKLFISHGGLLGVQEAVYHAVPILGFPFYLDQDQNMAYVKQNGVGESLEILDMTEEKISQAINDMLKTDLYKEKIKEMSTVFKDQPQTPLERAVFWVEFVMRHDGAYFLTSASRDLSRFVLNSYDVILFLLVVSLVIILVILTVIYILYILYKYSKPAFLFVVGILFAVGVACVQMQLV